MASKRSEDQSMVQKRIFLTLRSEKIFIVHGRNEIIRKDLVKFLKDLGKEPIVLIDEPSRGMTVVEKFEYYASDIDYAIVILTPDDIGGLRDKTEETHERARQNVIFELGFFTAKLGRGKVCLMSTSDIEIPSDLHGIVYIPIDNLNQWAWALVREFFAAGIDLDVRDLARSCESVLQSGLTRVKKISNILRGQSGRTGKSNRS